MKSPDNRYAIVFDDAIEQYMATTICVVRNQS